MKRVLVALSLLSLGACATPVYMYPANDQARLVGSPKVEFTSYGLGAGPFKVIMPDGEVLTGRYSVISGGYTGFGTLYGSVSGSGGVASGSAFGTQSFTSNSSPAIADATGPKTTVHCEVMSNNLNGHGNGVCELQPGGARFRIQY